MGISCDVPGFLCDSCINRGVSFASVRLDGQPRVGLSRLQGFQLPGQQLQDWRSEQTS